MDQAYFQESVDAAVSRVFYIEDFTLGNPKQDYLLRYRGRLRLEDSAAAYDQLAQSLRHQSLTPLFRIEDGRQVVYVVPGRPTPRASNPMINLVLGILTFFSVVLTGATFGLTEPLPNDIGQAIFTLLERGWPFAISMLAILGAHEFGHYLAGRHHGVHVTLPYFIPMPFSAFGTMGAFINMKEPPKNRRHLLDIGIAGPLAGLAVAIPVLLIGLSLSEITRLLPAPDQTIQLEGNSILYLAAKFLTFGQLLPAPANTPTSPLLYWIIYFFTGQPLPIGGLDVNLHPVAWAGWAGLLVTSMNLIPAGQLDGGHMLYVLIGRQKARKVLPFILSGLVLLGFAWQGWWLWAVIIFMLGRNYAEPLDQITPLDDRRKWLAVLALVVFLLTFIPVPLGIAG